MNLKSQLIEFKDVKSRYSEVIKPTPGTYGVIEMYKAFVVPALLEEGEEYPQRVSVHLVYPKKDGSDLGLVGLISAESENRTTSMHISPQYTKGLENTFYVDFDYTFPVGKMFTEYLPLLFEVNHKVKEGHFALIWREYRI